MNENEEIAHRARLTYKGAFMYLRDYLKIEAKKLSLSDDFDIVCSKAITVMSIMGPVLGYSRDKVDADMDICFSVKEEWHKNEFSRQFKVLQEKSW